MNDQYEKKKKRPRGLNELAFSIMKDATADFPEEAPTEEILPEKDPLAVELGRRALQK